MTFAIISSMDVAAGSLYLVSGVVLCQPVFAKVSHIWNSMLLLSRIFVNSLTTYTSKVNQVEHPWQQSSQKFLRQHSIRISRVSRVQQLRWQQSYMDEAEVKPVVVEVAVVVVSTAEADAEPTTVGLSKVRAVRVVLRRSGQQPTPDGRAPGTLICLHSARAGSIGIGESLRDFVKNPGHAHGSHSTVNLPTIKINETGTSPNHQ